MHYYLALTSRCNLNCKYCQGKSCEDFMSFDEAQKYDFDLPCVSDVSIEELRKFGSDDSEFTITFYGGEPLMQINKIKEFIDNVPAFEFMMQTNAMDLDKLPSYYVNKLSTILISIDGSKEHTDERRGDGVYDRVISNVKLIEKNGFRGEIIARMTVDETCDIYSQVRYLFENNDYNFANIHWQIDAQFFGADYDNRGFLDWVDSSYNPGISKLIDWWISMMRDEGMVVRLYPFIGVMKSLLTGERASMRCGAGHSCLGIQTNGKVVACPITAGYKPLYMGDVRESCLDDIKNARILPDGKCSACEILDICGGRCLYANKTQLWGDKGYDEVCSTIFHLVNELKRVLPEVERLIDEKKISIDDFNYKKYNGCEIIP